MPARVACVLLFLAAASSRGADAPRPPEPLSPAGLPGPLVIVGGGKMTDDIRKAFFDLAGKEKAKIVVVPTASTSADDAKELDSFLKQWQDLKPLSVEILHTRDAKKANDADFVKPLAEATGIWFSGGDQIAHHRGLSRYARREGTEEAHARGGGHRRHIGRCGDHERPHDRRRDRYREDRGRARLPSRLRSRSALRRSQAREAARRRDRGQPRSRRPRHRRIDCGRGPRPGRPRDRRIDSDRLHCRRARANRLPRIPTRRARCSTSFNFAARRRTARRRSHSRPRSRQNRSLTRGRS